MHLWWFRLDDPSLDGLATVEEQARAAGHRDPSDGERFLRGRAAVRLALAHHAGVSPQALVFDRRCRHCGHAEHGKPRVAAPEEAKRWRFSASRAGGWLGVALSETRDLGFDIEARDRARDIDAVAASFFAEAERAALGQGSGDERIRSFLRTWTLKEAYLKLRGHGLAVPLASVDTAEWLHGALVKEPLEPQRPIRIGHPDAPHGTTAALLADGPGSLELHVHVWDRELLAKDL